MIRVATILVLIFGTCCSALDVCDLSNSVDITNGTLSPKGAITFKDIIYMKNEYYYDSETNSLRGCVSKDKVSIKKCCPFGFGYDIDLRKCVFMEEKFEIPVWNKYKILEGVNATSFFSFVPGKVNCTPPEYRVRVGQVLKKYHVMEDGSLYVETPNTIPPRTIMGPDSYCIDTFVEEKSDGSWSSRVDALVCFEKKDESHQYILSSTGMLISCVFILATCAVYAWLPELRNLHGRVLVAYLLCLFVGFSLLATLQILLHVNNINTNWCLSLTIVIYFFLLSAFFWMNVMSFDIWWTFSGKRGLSLEKLSTRGRFFAYCLYAFSIPLGLTVLVVSLEFSGLPPHPLLPLLRYQGCFIYGSSKLLYLYGPIVILCMANLVFFILTAIKIAQIKQQTSVLKSKESSKHDQHTNDKQRLLLYVKLFCVMGINWILEVISSFYPDASAFWVITDTYNVLVGLIIFIIFVCKRKIFRLMKKRIKEYFFGNTTTVQDVRTLKHRPSKPWLTATGPRDSIETIKSSLSEPYNNNTKTNTTQL